MRAVVITEAGGPEVLALDERPSLRPGPAEALIAVDAVGVNRADALQRKGLYPAPPGVAADVPGLEFAGRVRAVGVGVSEVEPGDRVMGIVAGAAYAEELLTHARTLLPVPEGMSMAHAAAVPEAFLTAFDALFVQAGMRRGEAVLIHAVGSGVGTAALQLAELYGAQTIGTSRTESKLERAEALGLRRGLHCPDGFADPEVTALRETHPEGVDVIIDFVGGAYLEGNLAALAPGGRMVTLGLLGGAKGTIDLARLLTKRITLRGSTLRARPIEDKISLARRCADELLPALATGALRPIVERSYAMKDAAEAHRHLESNTTFGKLVLEW